MNTALTVGIIILVGFIFGEIAERIKLPKVTGFILAGVVLNPEFAGIVPKSFVDKTSIITNISLSFITFAIGGTLFYPRIKKLGKSIVAITLCEAEFAFLAVALGFAATIPFLIRIPGATFAATFLPVSLLIGSLASPTDPSAMLAVAHEYNARGEITSTVLGVSAFDDALGIINYSIAVVLAETFILHKSFSLASSALKPLAIIAGAVFLGAVFGLVFNLVFNFIKRETEGVLFAVILGLLALCFGIAQFMGVDELLATMTMGAVVVNFNEKREKIFKILERYTEELIFVLFFTLSGMYLDFAILHKSFALVLLFAFFRTLGKAGGTMLGGWLSGASVNVRKYTVGGLIPSGGIVVGLALVIKQNPAYSAISDIVISVIIGATVIHELLGAVIAKFALKKAGEI